MEGELLVPNSMMMMKLRVPPKRRFTIQNVQDRTLVIETPVLTTLASIVSCAKDARAYIIHPPAQHVYTVYS